MSFLKAMVLFGVYVLSGNDSHPTSTLFLILAFIKLVKHGRIKSINRQYLKKNALPYWHVSLQLSARSDQNISRLNSILTPWNRVLLQNLTVLQLVRKFSKFYTTCKFVTVFMRGHHFCASWAILIRFISTVSLCITLLSCECHMLHPSHHSGFDEESRSSGSSLFPFRSGYFPQLPIIRHPQTLLFA
jgi:hypothetical protein